MKRAEQKVHTRQRIVDAAGRCFRKGGFGGIGVDGLAKEAGVTSGAFYAHFDSKAAAFREAVIIGLGELKAGVLYYQSEYQEQWWSEFVNFYLGFKRTCDLADSCALQSLSPEVGRSNEVVREVFESGLLEVARAAISGPKSPGMPKDMDGALSVLSILVGTVTLARAVGSEHLSDQIAKAAKTTLLGCTD